MRMSTPLATLLSRPSLKLKLRSRLPDLSYQSSKSNSFSLILHQRPSLKDPTTPPPRHPLSLRRLSLFPYPSPLGSNSKLLRGHWLLDLRVYLTGTSIKLVIQTQLSILSLRIIQIERSTLRSPLN